MMKKVIENTFKKSIFTSYTFDNQHRLIVYNSMVGGDSILKFDERISEQIFPWLSNSSITECDAKNIPFWNKLVEQNIFVKTDIDEFKIAKSLLLPSVVDSSTLNLCILPTAQCNYRCRYCYENFELGRMSEETQEGIVKFVRRNIHNYAGMNVSWFGGEPLLAADIIDNLSKKFITICNISKRNYRASITSNGFLLDDVMLERMLKNKIYKIQISLDGLKETNDYNKPLISGAGTFDRIIDNIIKIRENCKSQLFHIAVRTNFTQKSIHECNSYLSFIKSIIEDDPRFSLFLRSVNNLGGKAVDEIASQILNRKEREDLYSLVANMSQKFYFNQHEQNLEPGALVCYAGKNNNFIIQPDGTISKCSCALYSSNNKIGSVNSTGKLDLNINKHAKWIMNSDFSEECKQCSILPLCFNMICPIAFINTNVKNVKKCPIEKESLNDLLIMIAQTKKVETQYEN